MPEKILVEWVPKVLLVILITGLALGLILALVDIIVMYGLLFYAAFIVFPIELFKKVLWLILTLFTGVKRGVGIIKKSRKKRYAK